MVARRIGWMSPVQELSEETSGPCMLPHLDAKAKHGPVRRNLTSVTVGHESQQKYRQRSDRRRYEYHFEHTNGYRA